MAGAAETTPLAGALGALTAEDSTQLNAALLSLRETLASSLPEQQGGSGCAPTLLALVRPAITRLRVRRMCCVQSFDTASVRHPGRALERTRPRRGGPCGGRRSCSCRGADTHCGNHSSLFARHLRARKRFRTLAGAAGCSWLAAHATTRLLSCHSTYTQVLGVLQLLVLVLGLPLNVRSALRVRQLRSSS